MAEEGNNEAGPETADKDSSQSPASSKDQPKDKTFLEKLKDYKEFILILIFFSGGFVWVYGYFATKQQVDKLECLLNANIGLFANEAKVKFKSEELVEVRSQIETFLQDPSGKPRIKKIKELEAQEQSINRELLEAEKIASESSALLLQNGCDHEK